MVDDHGQHEPSLQRGHHDGVRRQRRNLRSLDRRGPGRRSAPSLHERHIPRPLLRRGHRQWVGNSIAPGEHRSRPCLPRGRRSPERPRRLDLLRLLRDVQRQLSPHLAPVLLLLGRPRGRSRHGRPVVLVHEHGRHAAELGRRRPALSLDGGRRRGEHPALRGAERHRRVLSRRFDLGRIPQRLYIALDHLPVLEPDRHARLGQACRGRDPGHLDQRRHRVSAGRSRPRLRLALEVERVGLDAARGRHLRGNGLLRLPRAAGPRRRLGSRHGDV